MCPAFEVYCPFFKIKFFVSFEESSLQRCQFKISVETVEMFGCMKQFYILWLPISYWILCSFKSFSMVSISRDVFIDIFQVKHFSAVKFVIGYEKNMNFLVIPKSPKV